MAAGARHQRQRHGLQGVRRLDVSPNLANPLAGSVPFNLDPAGGCGLTLYRRTGGSVGAQIFDGTGEWVVDADAGVLTFYQSDVAPTWTARRLPQLRLCWLAGARRRLALDVVNDGIHYSDSNKTVLVARQSSAAAATYDFEVGADANSHAKFHGKVETQQVVCKSDRRLKKNIRTIRRPLTKLTGVRGVSFLWRSSGEKSYGVIADEIESQLPGARTSPDGTLAVNYNAAIALLSKPPRPRQADHAADQGAGPRAPAEGPISELRQSEPLRD